jgi:multidrug transporter EmrE-like cation transporter
MVFFIRHLYIFFTISFTVYGQLIIKWQVEKAGSFPSTAFERIRYLCDLILNPWVISSFIGAFLAALSWMAAMTEFDLSYAYPFMSLAFILVLVLSAFFFHEAITLPKILGIALITIGIIIGSRG